MEKIFRKKNKEIEEDMEEEPVGEKEREIYIQREERVRERREMEKQVDKRDGDRSIEEREIWRNCFPKNRINTLSMLYIQSLFMFIY